MAVVPTKTYSRRQNEFPNVSDREKENLDAFDELLLSPLKQEVQFEPLSFWDRKLSDLECKNKLKNVKYGLYETSVADENSINTRKKKTIFKYSKHAGRTLPLRGTRDKKSVYSTMKLPIKNNESRIMAAVDNITVMPFENIGKHSSWSSDSARYFSESRDKTFSSSFKSNNEFKVYKDNQLQKRSCTSKLRRNYTNTKKKHGKVRNGSNIELKGSISPQNMTFKIYEDVSAEQENYEVTWDEPIKKKSEESENFSLYFDNIEETLAPFFESHESFKFISAKRYLNNFDKSNENLNFTSSTVGLKYSNANPSWNQNSIKEIILKNAVSHATIVEDKRTVLEFMGGNTVLDEFDSFYTNTSKLEDFTQESLVEKNGFNIEKDVSELFSPTKDVSRLTTGISHLTISNTTSSDKMFSGHEPENRIENDTDIKVTDAEDDSTLIDLRNVTTKRKYSIDRYQWGISQIDKSKSCINAIEYQSENSQKREWEINETIEQTVMTNEINFDWNRTECFLNPIFESTRVHDTSINDHGKFLKPANQSEKTNSILEESQSWPDHSYALKPGKKWRRSMSVLKQIQNGSVAGNCFQYTRIKGSKFESFVKDIMEMQSGVHQTNLNKTRKSLDCKKSPTNSNNMCSIIEQEESPKNVTVSDAFFSLSFNKTGLEISIINPTVRAINTEEKSSDLVMTVSDLLLQGECLVGDQHSCVSGRDFVLLHCGQKEVLPFEEHFNESTLKDCKKIGEGVYGEVFKNADTVLKIIPIEGSEKVNGEPQKTFEEILSEVIIASKLSNLRNGEKNRTEGFSEMKRCWCVKGRYPKYLLQLWDEYDRWGNGSENDSPVMFKDDQLYIILELANGGKNLEAYVFSSLTQALSIFLQTALSLATAEEAFEFEHRDLHWGNLLISETKEKFITIILDNITYKIPSKGVKVCIIDFTLSRVNHEGYCIFNDLSVDPGLFTSEGDYQFEIYRMMLREVRNDWSLFRPKTNIFWMHYTLDKMITMVRYKSKNTKVHKKYMKRLESLKSTILDYKDLRDFVLSDSARDMISSL